MSETRHHLRSVSDLYAADEIEVLLLEEIRDLEPVPSAYSRPEDIQDFEIGSRTGGRISSQSSELDSPGVHSTVHSWDSHANYHGHYGQGDQGHGSSSNALQWPRASHLVLYCDVQGHLKSTTGVLRLLLLISSVACLATLCSSGTAKVSLFMLPLVGRLRFMIFVAVFCILVTVLLLFLDISHVAYFFPFNWARLNFWIFIGIAILYLGGSTLLLLSVWEYSESGWVPRRTRSQLTASAAFGLFCTVLSSLLAWLHGRSEIKCHSQSSRDHTPNQLYKPVDNSSSSGVTLKERSPKRPPSWVVKNQKKRNADSDTNTNGGNKGNGNGANERYKPGGNKKDHWASARQHFLPHSQEDEEVEDVQRDEREMERRRRRRRRDRENSLGGNGNPTSSKSSGGLAEDAAKPATRRVPKKLPLKTLDKAQLRAGIERKDNGTRQPEQRNRRTSNELRDYWAIGDARQLGGTTSGNGPHWEVEGTSNNGRSEMIAVSLTRAMEWSGQWRPPPDDVQPCSSKTVDPYTFA
ncbi:uncharacterized protein LOC105701864 isoform X2 [Orussus abietinus]|uniref:uncharacterized protein LOC105701864 isoform X2 n=1 Tax=Orussus abietinus TaxID=222816 RepID=UPI00062656F7|nr:uncharacterized protein LOC105701864 isoform X2 [Orussus abietinus]